MYRNVTILYQGDRQGSRTGLCMSFAFVLSQPSSHLAQVRKSNKEDAEREAECDKPEEPARTEWFQQ